MRPSMVAVLALAILLGCGTPALRPAAVATPENETGWRWAGWPVALVGRATGVAFEREGALVANAPDKRVRITARCVGCASATPLEFDATTPAVKYELDPGIAESINASVIFPAEGTWSFEPFGGQITVRSPTSTQPPVVIVRPWSVTLTADCGPKQIENVVTSFAQAFNGGSPVDLAHSLNPLVNFSMTEPVPFATKKRDEVGDYVRIRFLAGETIHPYLVYAASIGANAVELLVYYVRKAPDLPTSNSGYRRAAAMSQLFCYDLSLLRFNSGQSFD